jgi:hypothetical protein
MPKSKAQARARARALQLFTGVEAGRPAFREQALAADQPVRLACWGSEEDAVTRSKRWLLAKRRDAEFRRLAREREEAAEQEAKASKELDHVYRVLTFLHGRQTDEFENRFTKVQRRKDALEVMVRFKQWWPETGCAAASVLPLLKRHCATTTNDRLERFDQVVASLVDAVIDVDALNTPDAIRGEPPLVWAIRSWCPQTIRALLRHAPHTIALEPALSPYHPQTDPQVTNQIDLYVSSATNQVDMEFAKGHQPEVDVAFAMKRRGFSSAITRCLSSIDAWLLPELYPLITNYVCSV